MTVSTPNPPVMRSKTVDPREAEVSNIQSLLQKEFGKESIHRFIDQPTLADDVVSSGSICIDRAMGIGGFARGRIFEFYGQESSGKCLVADSYVFCEDGALTIEEIFKKKGLLASRTAQATDVRYGLLNRYGKLESTTKFTHNYVRPVWAVKTRSGFSVKSTANHPFLVMNERGNWVWKQTKELAVGDYLLSPRKFSNGIGVDSGESDDLFYMLGTLIADGCMVSKNRVQITNDDPYVMRFIENTMTSIIGVPVKSYDRKNGKSKDFHLNGKEAVDRFFSKYGLEHVLSKGKTVPLLVRTSTIRGVREFLRGYLDCECAIDVEQRVIEVCSASYKLLEQVKLLLLVHFSINSFLNPKVVKGYEENAAAVTEYFRLNIYGADAAAFATKVGARSEIRQKALSLLLAEERQTNTNTDSIPHCEHLLSDLVGMTESTREHYNVVADYLGDKKKANLTYDRLGRILDLEWADSLVKERLREIYVAKYFYDPIESIEAVGDEPTFDFEMEKSHSFIANGLVVHNTSLAVSICAESQRLGGKIGYVDAEHAMDRDYCVKLGLDLRYVLISQPDCGEQGLEITERMVESGVDIVVVDSVAALTPKAELEGEMGDSHMGLQARMMSQAMRKLVAVVGKSKSIVIFINQLRQKIGIVYGNPSVTTGGNALKFYAAARLELVRGEKITIGDKEIGCKVKVKVNKNKLGIPHQNTECEMIYGQGFSKVSDIIEIGKELNIIEAAGAWMSYGGERIGQGKENAKTYLLTNPEIMRQIEYKIRQAIWAPASAFVDVVVVKC